MATAKPLPPHLERFVHGTPFASHRDFAHHHPASSHASTSSSFRHQWPAPGAGNDDDFGRFASTSAASSASSGVFGGGARATASAAGYPASNAYERKTVGDGGDVMGLLGSAELNEAVSGDWEAELMADRTSESARWKTQYEEAVPLDPEVSMQIVGKGTEVEDYWSAAAGSAKGKGKAVARQGDVSPATSELIRGVDAMDLTDKASLKSFLSLANEHSLSTLLELKGRGAYTDAVWGGVEVSEGVRRVLEKAREDESGGKSAGEEEAKARAVRRLGMVMRHLNASGGGAEATFATPTYQDNTGNEFQHFARTTPSTQSPFQSTPTLLDASSHKLLASPNSFSSTSPLTSTSGDPRVVDSPASLSSLDNIVTSESTSTLDSQTPLFGAGMISRGGASRLQSHQQQHPYSFYGADTDSLPRARGEVYGRTDSENLVMPPSASSTSSTRGATSHVFALAPGAEESVREGSNEDGEEEEERDGTLTPFAEFMQDKLLAMGGTSGGGLCYRG